LFLSSVSDDENLNIFLEEAAFFGLAEEVLADEIPADAELSGETERCCEYCHQPFIPALSHCRGLCPNPVCITRRQEATRVKYLATHGCPQCGGSMKNHLPPCDLEILQQIGLPQGPCPWCGSPPYEHTRACQVNRFITQEGLCPLCGRLLDPTIPYPDPDFVNRDHIKPYKNTRHRDNSQNIQLAHKRCNDWKADNPSPCSQPPWGVLENVPVVETYQRRPRRRGDGDPFR
jgi:hypothetical protein